MYERGDGVACDYAEAARWARKAAEHGNADAQLTLGHAYRWGQGVPQSYTEAARWYRKAAEQGEMVGRYYLADAYRRGEGVPRNYFEAAYWFLKFFGPIALHCTRRQGWTTLITVVLLLSAVLVPKRRWGRARWLPSALISVGGATYVLHLVSRQRWCWPGRTFGIVFFAAMSVAYAYAAVGEAVRERKSGSDPGEPPTPPAEAPVSPA